MKKGRTNIKKTIKKRIEDNRNRYGYIEKSGQKKPNPVHVDLIMASKEDKRAALRVGGIKPQPQPQSLFPEQFKPILVDKKPLSIIISAYQTQNFIEECLDSIEKQTYFINNDNFEVLVGVDACQETLNKLLEIRNKYRNLRIFMMDSNKGTYVTSNTMLSLINNENIIRFDSDDIMRPEMIEKLLNFNEKFDVIRYKVKNFGTYQNNFNEKYAVGTMFFKKNVFDLFGGWKSWVCSADNELFKRIENHVNVGYLNDILCERRIHATSLTRKLETSGSSEIRKKYNTIIRKSNYDKIIFVDKIKNTYKEYKLKVCFIYDVKGWAFFNMANDIRSVLTEFDIDIIKYDELNIENKYDVIIAFSPRVLPKNKKNIDRIICGISSHIGNHNTVAKKFPFVFTNDIKIYNELSSVNKFYLPNGVNTTFFKSEKIRKLGDEIKIGVLGSQQRAKHKGSDRVKKITNELRKLGYNVVNKSKFVDVKGDILTQDEIKGFYDELDILIISSISETGPNPLLEAMSMGLPVISNRVGLADKLIINGVTGYLIESYGSVNEYILAIENLIKNGDIYSNISKNTVFRISEYDWVRKCDGFRSMIYEFIKNTYK